MESLIQEQGGTLSIEVTVNSPLGLHARPAARLVQELQNFTADVRINHEGLHANAKSILDIMSLAATSGSTLLLTAEGDDARPALLRAAELITSGFKE